MRENVAYIVSNELAKFSSLLPSNKNRSVLVHTLAKELGLLSSKFTSPRSICPVRPQLATLADLSAYHTRDYLEFVLNPNNPQSVDKDGAVGEFGLEDDCPYFPGLPEYVRLVGGGSLTAANALIQNQATIAIHWDGGRHHAQKAQASGFCYVADCILAILALKKSRLPCREDGLSRKPRILYLDLDLHFSDGVSQSFASSGTAAGAQVLTLSIHHSAPGFFPATPLSALSDPDNEEFDPWTLSLPLARGTSDRTFATIWPSVEAVKDAYQPDYVVVQCGVDGLAGDPYATWNWSLGESEGSLGWCIDRICNHWQTKILLLGGGGYHSPNAARAWAYLTSIALGQPLSLDTDIPDHNAFPLYAPSFTLDIPSGNTSDQNTPSSLDEVNTRFARVAEIIRRKTPSNTQ